MAADGGQWVNSAPWHLRRTKEQRQAERRRIAERAGKVYRTAEERAEIAAARRAEREARAPGRKPSMSAEERRAYDRARARRYYEQNRAAVIARNGGYRRRKVAGQVEGYKAMQRACVQRWEERNPGKVRTIRRKAKLTRRARKRRAFVDAVDPVVVYTRDGGLCGICRMPVPIDSGWHVDHVVPLSRGGEHSYANVQLAHAACNVMKGATMSGVGAGWVLPTHHKSGWNGAQGSGRHREF